MRLSCLLILGLSLKTLDYRHKKLISCLIREVKTINKLPRIGDFLYAESGILIARHLRVINVEEKENISDSIITVIGKYGRKYIEPLWMFTGIE